MSYILKERIANKTNYGSIRNTSSIEWIVMHYTANDGDRAYNNANYFQTNPNLKASAHYFVDDTSVYRSVPDNYVAYSVGGSKYSGTKGGKYYGQCTNFNSLSIELCDTVRNGKYECTEATKANAVQLTLSLMNKYNINKDHVIRHYDVTGKVCPAYWVDDSKWEKEFHSKLVVLDGWSETSDGWRWYDSNGEMAKNGWKTINGNAYYFWPNGIMASYEFIKSADYETNSKLYYVDEDGRWDNKEYRWMQDSKGWWLTCIGEKWYPKDEWWKIDSKWYYFDESGYMVTGVKTINGKEYTFSEDGVWLS
jgi:glucan-binding YG repeat protein